MHQLWTITATDLRQRVRDKSVIIFGLIVPFALMTVFNFLFSGVEEETELQPITVAANVPSGDRMGEVVLQALRQVDAMEVTIEQAPADEVRDLSVADAGIGVVVPEGFSESVRAGGEPTVQVVRGDDAGLEGGVVTSVVRGAADRLTSVAVTATAGGASDLSPEELATISRQAATTGPQIALTQGQASDEQLTMQGTFVAGQAGLFLFFTVGFGVLALLAEREQGTMPRLLSMPLRPSTVVAAKALTGFILGVVATSVLLILGSLMFDADLGSVVPIAALVVCAVGAATSLTFIIARLARTAEQAQVIQTIVAVVLGMSGGAFFPIQSTGALAPLLEINPVASLVRGLGITSGGGGLGDIGVPVAFMVGFAVVCLVISRLVPDRAARA